MPGAVELFQRFRRRPAVYTGESTIESIRCFLDGYHFALEQRGLSTDNDPFVLPGEFHDWVAYRLHYYESTSGWCNMIRGQTGTQQQAIDKFFELLQEFHTRKPHIVARVQNCPQTYTQLTMSRSDNEVILEDAVERSYPELISLVTYTDDPGFFANSDVSGPFAVQRFYPDLEAFQLLCGVDRSLIEILNETWDPKPFPR